MTREEVIKLLQEEVERCQRAPELNGCEMKPEWQQTMDVCQIAIDAIREQEERRWIPASEPPKDSEPVLVCTKHRKPFKARYSTEWKRWDVSGSVVITQWMPLPEPPKEET